MLTEGRKRGRKEGRKERRRGGGDDMMTGKEEEGRKEGGLGGRLAMRDRKR